MHKTHLFSAILVRHLIVGTWTQYQCIVHIDILLIVITCSRYVKRWCSIIIWRYGCAQIFEQRGRCCCDPDWRRVAWKDKWNGRLLLATVAPHHRHNRIQQFHGPYGEIASLQLYYMHGQCASAEMCALRICAHTQYKCYPLHLFTYDKSLMYLPPPPPSSCMSL